MLNESKRREDGVIPRSPHVIWASVAIVALLVGGSVTLAALERDVTVVLSLAAIVAVPVLGAFGVGVWQKLDSVKDHVNGNAEADKQTIRELQETVKELALRVPTMIEDKERQG